MFSHAVDYAEGQFVSGSPTECALLGRGSSGEGIQQELQQHGNIRVMAEREPELTQKKQQDAERGCRAPLS